MAPPPFAYQSATELAIREGRAFRAYHERVLTIGETQYLVGTTGALNIFMTVRQVFADGGGLRLTLLEQPSIVGAGAPVIVRNVNRNSGRLPTLVIRNGSIAVTGGEPLEESYIVGGGHYGSPSRNETAWVLRRNAMYALRVANAGHSVMRALLSWFWYEEDA